MQQFRSLKKQQQQGLIAGGVLGLALFVAIIAILLSRSDTSSGSGIDFANLPDGIEIFETEDGAHVIGDPDAPVTIVAFEDFFCPACISYEPTMERILKEIVLEGQAKLEYRFLLTQGATAEYAFELAECAQELAPEQGGFWVAHGAFFQLTANEGRSVTQDRLRSRLQELLDISAAELVECTRDANQMGVDIRYASRNGISSTPSLRLRVEGSDNLELINNQASGGVSFSNVAATVELFQGLSQ